VARTRELEQATKDRLNQAVEAVESCSSAEVVVAVRGHAGSYGAVGPVLGSGLAYLSLLYMLFAPQEFGLVWMAAIVPLAFVLGWVLVRVFRALSVACTRSATVDQAVKRAAQATFVDLGVSATQGRTGVLIYIACRERKVHVVADLGVVAKVPKDAWKAALAGIESLSPTRKFDPESGTRTAVAIEGLRDLLGEFLPRADDDIDELKGVQ